ncbi:hypothetical protein B566_EDAN006978 [Ephemera danica]|nr:hypothetical protein B566_EDAN006978 [Ephemera danica]
MAHLQNVVTKVLDANRYASKKTIAQGMLDIALLTANASQLKYILQVGKQHEFYTLMVTLISISIVLQVVMGCLALTLNMLRDCRLHRPEFRYSALFLNYASLVGSLADILNDLALIVVFIISILNVIISGFGLEQHPQLLKNLHREDIIEP